jgi:hypothetical protein
MKKLTGDIVYKVILKMAEDSNNQKYDETGNKLIDGSEPLPHLWFSLIFPLEISIDGPINCEALSKRLNEALE